MAGSYNRFERMEMKVDLLYNFILSFLLAFQRKIRPLLEGFYRRPYRVIEWGSSGDKSIFYVIMYPPGDYYRLRMKPIVWLIYISTQRSPLRFYQFVTRYGRLTRMLEKKIGVPCDWYFIHIGPRPTQGIFVEVYRLRRSGRDPRIFFARSPKEAIDFIVNYIENRLRMLIEKSKKIFGENALLALFFGAFIKEFRGKIPEILESIKSQLLKSVGWSLIDPLL
ncbi:MAG: hypothetical protein J7K21_01040 [Desulfurococcales archaeon]|nr:hypothetical protein [Desulfurococcales archaeon]